MNKLTLREVQGEYHGNDNCMTEILAALPARDLTVEEAFELYKEAVKWSDGDEVIVKQEDSKNPEFNAGFWCAIKNMVAEGVSEGSLRRVLEGAGFIREEYEAMIAGDDYKKEIWMPVVNKILKDRKEEELPYSYTEEKWLPAFVVPYFVNSDATGMEDSEIQRADECMKDLLDWYEAKSITVVYNGGEPTQRNLGYPMYNGLHDSLLVTLVISNFTNAGVVLVQDGVNGEHLCKCNNCGIILYDENPQTGAKKYKTDNLDVYSMDKGDEDEWVCPNCMVDDYLNDL